MTLLEPSEAKRASLQNLQVAGAVHDRTSDMVEALYNMNRVNPSLPLCMVGQ